MSSVNLTADAAAGATSITVTDTSHFQVGQIVLLDENAGASWQPDVTGTATSIWASPDYRVTYKKHNPAIQYVDDFDPNVFPTTPGSFGDIYSRLDRPTNELKEIASISGKTVTFTSPISISYRTGHAAQLSWYIDAMSGTYVPHVRNAGVENLSIQGGDDGSLQFSYCAYCWAKNVENSVWIGVGIDFTDSFRCELREFYSHDAAYSQPGGGAYAIGLDMRSSEVLIEDGISIRADKVMVARAAGAGSVVGYNYMDDGFIDYNENWIEIGLNASHFVGPHHVLFEGNYGFNADSDDTHGASIYMTYFRNWLRGIRAPFVNPETGDTVNDATQFGNNGPMRTAGAMSYSYWFSYVGNVLGAPGQMNGWVYETDFSGGPGIWMMGWDGQTDPNVKQNMIRGGNYDYLTNSQAWTNNLPYQTLPTSLYLKAKPGFFGNDTWPWVQPENSTQQLYTLPAKARFEAGTPFGLAPGATQ
jgi:hypothetical protein